MRFLLVHTFRRLEVWKKSREAALAVYRMTLSFPPQERFSLTAQLRRAALSVVCNVVEGSKRSSSRDFAHFLNIAEGSAAEAGLLIGLSVDLGFVSSADAAQLADTYLALERMLWVLRQRVTRAA